MLRINELTDEFKQKHTLVLPDGTSFTMIIEYKPLQTGWFITSLTYGEFQIYNLRVVTSPNMLHQYRNQIPFGLACFVQEDQEPMLQQDFSSSRAKAYVLTEEEVDLYEDFLSGQAAS